MTISNTQRKRKTLKVGECSPEILKEQETKLVTSKKPKCKVDDDELKAEASYAINHNTACIAKGVFNAPFDYTNKIAKKDVETTTNMVKMDVDEQNDETKEAWIYENWSNWCRRIIKGSWAEYNSDQTNHSGIELLKDMRQWMAPVGRSIKKVESADEMITMFAGLIKTLYTPSYELGAIHRDISLENIQFSRDKAENPHICLIDYDYAGMADEDVKNIRTGTPTYMSICNLLKTKNVPRTILDDLESTMYLVSVLGGYGVNWDDKNKIEGNSNIYIRKWTLGRYEAIAQEKMNHMANDDTFMRNITNNFRRTEEYKALALLVHQLRQTIFNNPNLSSKSHGTTDRGASFFGQLNWEVPFVSQTGFKDDHVEDSVTDPFLRRTKRIDFILDDVMQVVEQAKKEAIDLIDNRASSSSS